MRAGDGNRGVDTIIADLLNATGLEKHVNEWCLSGLEEKTLCIQHRA